MQGDTLIASHTKGASNGAFGFDGMLKHGHASTAPASTPLLYSVHAALLRGQFTQVRTP